MGVTMPAEEPADDFLRYEEATALCLVAPAADELPEMAVLAGVDGVLRTAVIPDVLPLVATADVPGCLVRDTAALVPPDAVAAPLLADEVPDNVPVCPPLGPFVLRTLEPEEVRCPKYLSGCLSITRPGPCPWCGWCQCGW